MNRAGPLRRRLFLCLSGVLLMLSLGSLAWALHLPLLFPPLGAAAYLMLSAPQSLAAQPRSALLGHLIGAACGWFALQLVGRGAAPAPELAALDFLQVLSCALALGSTCALLDLVRAPHPPAGATTLVVALGQFSQLWQLLLIMVAVLVLVLLCALLLRFAKPPDSAPYS